MFGNKKCSFSPPPSPFHSKTSGTRHSPWQASMRPTDYSCCGYSVTFARIKHRNKSRVLYNNTKMHYYRNCRPRKRSPSLNERQSLTEQSVICAIAGERGKLALQPRGHFPIRPQESRKVETVVLKWIITNSRNPELRGSLVYSVNTLLSNGAYECEGIYYCFVRYINVLCCTKPNGTLLRASSRAEEILLWWLVLQPNRCRS